MLRLLYWRLLQQGYQVFRAFVTGKTAELAPACKALMETVDRLWKLSQGYGSTFFRNRNHNPSPRPCPNPSPNPRPRRLRLLNILSFRRRLVCSLCLGRIGASGANAKREP